MDNFTHFSVHELKRLDNSLDLFEGGTELEPGLLRDGFYTPLCVSGSRLVWGFHLLGQAEKHGIESLRAIRREPMDAAASLKLALILENRTGRYTYNEKERIFHAMVNLNLSGAEIPALVEGRADQGFMERMRQYSGLNPVLKNLVRTGALDLKTGLEIRDLPESVLSRMIIHPAWETFSHSNKRLFLTRFHESFKRDIPAETRTLEILEGLLASGEPLHALDALRYPAFTALSQKFEEFKERHLHESGVKLSPPPYFEGGVFSVSFSFTNAKNLGKKIARLHGLKEHADELFAII
jgi:hypothetical protein